MSCHSSKGSNCVKDVVRAIVDAQDEVAGRDCCSTGCDRSIAELLSPSSGNGNNATTIPFILYCGCKPFFGSGVERVTNGTSRYHCVESPVFRACKFVEDSDNCVQLELLQPVHGSAASCTRQCDSNRDVCDFLNNVVDFYATGICITVDLDCFCAISCLDPIRPTTTAPMRAMHSKD
ncbi:CotY/CotZ family spore coat protein [Halobacillus rhizosphaerae]|uniref:CotY/CotZ family spore coat protein n=1 Tax=Halobacillus rhizosphaerae TaxID=3064889 RepID=UPI00398B1B76